MAKQDDEQMLPKGSLLLHHSAISHLSVYMCKHIYQNATYYPVKCNDYPNIHDSHYLHGSHFY